METPVIKYNLRDRGRKHVGQPRNFNIKAICDAINGPACQERVSTRGLVGYYGHMPRIRFGMNPVEGVLDNGKYVPIEPAFVTTYLKADYDGNVEHRAEFLDTAAGRLAAKLFDSKMGGFSSAIDTSRPEFHGMDYVLEPNFIQNSYRGVVLDYVMGGGDVGEMTYDDVYEAEKDEQAQAMSVLLDSIATEREVTNTVIERLSAENEQLLSMLASKGVVALSALDSVSIMPIAVSIDPMERIKRDAQTFRSAELPRFSEPAVVEQSNPLYDRLLGKFSR